MSNKKSQQPKTSIKILIAIFAFVIGFFSISIGYCYANKPQSDSYGSELSFHFLTLGNKYNGDSYYIKCGNIDILVDGGSRESSVETIYNYVNPYVTDGIIEYAIVTHADRDHIASFAGNNTYQSLFQKFNITTCIDFALTNSTSQTYQRYITQRDNAVTNGMTHFTAKQCVDQTDGARNSFTIGVNTTLNILWNKYYYQTSSDENEYSVIFQIEQGNKKFLFTGDLEGDGEKAFADHYGPQLSQVELFKAGHHGSKTSNTTKLLSYIQPKICVVSCVAGYNEYGASEQNVFPTQAFISNIGQYTSNVYVTSQYNSSTEQREDLNGNIVVTSNTDGVSVNCSNNNTVLKDSTWFNNSTRTWPT